MDIKEDLEKALDLIKKERFEDARGFIEKDLIQKDTNNHFLYYLHGYCLIHMNRLDEALLTLGEVNYLSPRHRPTMHALAFIMLQKGDFEGCLNKWLHISTCYPKDKLAKRNINLMKGNKINRLSLRFNPNDFLILDESQGMQTLIPVKQSIETYPKEENSRRNAPSPSKRRKTLSFLTLSALSLSLIIVFFSLVQPKKESFFENISKNYEMNEDDIRQQKNEFERLVNQRKYNGARFILNKMLLSKLPTLEALWVKTKLSSLETPESPAMIDMKISPRDFVREPKLYEGLWVSWFGKINKLEVKKDFTSFLFQSEEGESINATLMEPNFSVTDGEYISLFGALSTQNNRTPTIEIFELARK